MKRSLLYFVLVFFILSCNDDEKTIEVVQENLEFGAIIRTLDLTMAEFDIDDITSRIQIAIEEQDKLNGALLETLEVYVSFVDRTPGNGDFSSSETLLDRMEADTFTQGPSPERYPRSSLNYSFSELLDAVGVNYTSVLEKDQFLLRLNLQLTDGRSFTTGNAISDIIAFDTFYSSPYCYTINVVKPMPPDLFTGIYVLSSVEDGFFGIPFISHIEEGVTTFVIEKSHSYNVRTFKALYSIGHRGGEQPRNFKFTIAGDESVFQKNQFSSYRGKCTNVDPTILLGPRLENAIIDPMDDGVFELSLVEGYLGFDGGCGFGTHASTVRFSKQ